MKVVSTVATPVLDVALLSIYLMHASGTEIKSKHVLPKLRKAREKKKKVVIPEIRFKVLDLGLGMRQSLKEAKEEGLGLSRAFICVAGILKHSKSQCLGERAAKLATYGFVLTALDLRKKAR